MNIETKGEFPKEILAQWGARADRYTPTDFFVGLGELNETQM
jgi:hypothetical protein